MRHEHELKRKEEKHLPPEELLRILRGIYPEDVAVQLFEKLTGINAEMFDKDTNVRSKGEDDADVQRCGCVAKSNVSRDV